MRTFKNQSSVHIVRRVFAHITLMEAFGLSEVLLGDILQANKATRKYKQCTINNGRVKQDVSSRTELEITVKYSSRQGHLWKSTSFVSLLHMSMQPGYTFI